MQDLQAAANNLSSPASIRVGELKLTLLALLLTAIKSTPSTTTTTNRASDQHLASNLLDSSQLIAMHHQDSTTAAAQGVASSSSGGWQLLDVNILLTTVYLAIFIIGIVGNICNCLVIADSKNKYMKTATNYYLFSLSISDLLLLTFGLPHDLVNLWHPSPYLFNQFVCISRGWISEASTNASVLVIVAFTVERYLAICHPLRAHTLSRLSRSVKIIVLIWLVASSCALVVVMQYGISMTYEKLNGKMVALAQCTTVNRNERIFELSVFIFFIIPMAVITILYVKLGYHLRNKTFLKKQNQLLRQQQRQQQQNSHHRAKSANSSSSSTTTTANYNHHHQQQQQLQTNVDSSSKQRPINNNNCRCSTVDDNFVVVVEAPTTKSATGSSVTGSQMEAIRSESFASGLSSPTNSITTTTQNHSTIGGHMTAATTTNQNDANCDQRRRRRRQSVGLRDTHSSSGRTMLRWLILWPVRSRAGPAKDPPNSGRPLSGDPKQMGAAAESANLIGGQAAAAGDGKDNDNDGCGQLLLVSTAIVATPSKRSSTQCDSEDVTTRAHCDHDHLQQQGRGGSRQNGSGTLGGQGELSSQVNDCGGGGGKEPAATMAGKMLTGGGGRNEAGAGNKKKFISDNYDSNGRGGVAPLTVAADISNSNSHPNDDLVSKGNFDTSSGSNDTDRLAEMTTKLADGQTESCLPMTNESRQQQQADRRESEISLNKLAPNGSFKLRISPAAGDRKSSWAQANHIRASPSPSSQHQQQQQHQQQHRKSLSRNSAVNNSANVQSVIKMLVSVVVMFFICWAPFHAQRLMAVYVTEPTPGEIYVYNLLNHISGISYYISAVVNPILYSLFSVKFRQAFRDTFSRICSIRNSGS